METGVPNLSVKNIWQIGDTVFVEVLNLLIIFLYNIMCVYT